MVAENINGTDFLFVANKHGNVIETFKISNTGSLERVSLIEDTAKIYLGTAITLQVIMTRPEIRLHNFKHYV